MRVLFREVVSASSPQGQAGQGCEQPDLGEDVPAHCRVWPLNVPPTHKKNYLVLKLLYGIQRRSNTA